MLNKDTRITVLGGGQAGLSLIRALRSQGSKAAVTLIDKDRYFVDKSDIFSLLLNSRRSGIIDRQDFCREHKVSFVMHSAERVNYKRKTVFFKEEDPVTSDILVLSSGLYSRDLDIRGDHREGFFYFSDIDLFKLRDRLSLAEDIVIYASTLSGLRMAYSLSGLSKDIKLFTGDCSFLGSEKEALWERLVSGGIDIYENVSLLEIVGERSVKAVKTSLPRVFSAHLVLADSGLTSFSRLLPEGQNPCCGQTSFPGVYMIGAVSDREAEHKKYFSGYSRTAQDQAVILAGVLEQEPETEACWPGFVQEEFSAFVSKVFMPREEISSDQCRA